MIAFKIEFDDSHLQEVFATIVTVLPQSILDGVKEEARKVNAEIRALEPRGSGELQATTGEFDSSYLEPGVAANPEDAVFWFGKSKEGEYTAVIGSNLPYAKFVNDGYTAGENQFARFYESGKVVFRRLVPGTYYPGLYFFERGAEAAQPDFERVLQKSVKYVVHRYK